MHETFALFLDATRITQHMPYQQVEVDGFGTCSFFSLYCVDFQLSVPSSSSLRICVK